jgi:hypothetical protein
MVNGFLIKKEHFILAGAIATPKGVISTLIVWK